MRVVAIHIAPGRRIPARSVGSVSAEEGKGLVGDRYHGAKYRHVTIQSRELLDLAANDLSRDIDSGATRRNITVDAGDIPTKLGTPIRIGDVELHVVRAMPPCRLLDDDLGAGAMDALRGRGGAVCRVIASGTIRVGDAVVIGSVSASA